MTEGEMRSADVKHIRDMYTELRDMTESLSEIEILVRLSKRIEQPHSGNILKLLKYHICQGDRELYTKLMSSTGETQFREIMGDNNVLTYHSAGQYGVMLDSKLFDDKFLKIVGAYILYTDEHCS
jgi:hypothetical protein